MLVLLPCGWILNIIWFSLWKFGFISFNNYVLHVKGWEVSWPQGRVIACICLHLQGHVIYLVKSWNLKCGCVYYEMKNRGESFYFQWQGGETRKNITREKLSMAWACLLVGLANCQICRIKVFVLKLRLGKEKEKNSYLLIVVFLLDANCKLSPLTYSPQPIWSSLTLLHAPMTLVQWRACFSWSFLFPLLCF